MISRRISKSGDRLRPVGLDFDQFRLNAYGREILRDLLRRILRWENPVAGSVDHPIYIEEFVHPVELIPRALHA